MDTRSNDVFCLRYQNHHLQITLEEAFELLKTDKYRAVSIDYVYGDFFFRDQYYSSTLINSELPKEDVFFLYVDLDIAYHVGIVIAPTDLALLYVLSIPGTKIYEDILPTNLRDGRFRFWAEYLSTYFAD